MSVNKPLKPGVFLKFLYLTFRLAFFALAFLYCFLVHLMITLQPLTNAFLIAITVGLRFIIAVIAFFNACRKNCPVAFAAIMIHLIISLIRALVLIRMMRTLTCVSLSFHHSTIRFTTLQMYLMDHLMPLIINLMSRNVNRHKSLSVSLSISANSSFHDFSLYALSNLSVSIPLFGLSMQI